MKDILDRIRNPRWPVVLYALCGLTIVALLWWRLGTLLPGWSASELSTRAASNSIHNIIGNPLYLPYKLLQYTLLFLGRHGRFWMRLVSTVFGAAIIVVYYQILRTWYSSRVALLCSFLFLTSAWFLHFARLGTPSILFGCSVGLLWFGIRLKDHAISYWTILYGGLITILLLYVPGFIWIIGAFTVWQRREISQTFKHSSKLQKILITLGTVVGLAPLIHSFYKHPSLIKIWLGLPTNFTPPVLWYNFWHIPVWLILQGPQIPVYWLGHVPLLDIFSIAMAILGIYVLSHHIALDRVKAMLYITIVGVILTVLNGPVWLFILAPIMYLLVAAGVALLLQQWFTVFPRNPLARSLGIVLVGGVVLFAAYYNLHHYFIAWPHDPITKQFFRFATIYK